MYTILNNLLKYNSKFLDEIKAKEAEIKTHKGEINKIKTSLKKNNVLNLEMEAYEKSLKESSQKLEVKTLRVTEVGNIFEVVSMDLILHCFFF